MRTLLLTALVAVICAVAAAGAFAAANPSGTGLPSQTCLSSTAPNEPGNAASAPGSAFNETLPGKAGTVYNETSQYDVACYQVSPH
jgi:hypothetical protein